MLLALRQAQAGTADGAVRVFLSAGAKRLVSIAMRARASGTVLSRWLGGALLAASFAFIASRLWGLDWARIELHATWQGAAAVGLAAVLFAAADRALGLAWAEAADPERSLGKGELSRIYARGVLMKYLPGSVFQYLGRQIGGAQAGLLHRNMVRSTIGEAGLHLVASMTVAAACLWIDEAPAVVAGAALLIVGACLTSERHLLTSLGYQLTAFSAFALAAALIAWTIIPGELMPARFAGLFLLAWMVGFVVPLAPGGLGVREAALLALAGSSVPAGPLLAVILILRSASITGDLAYGVATLRSRGR